jgi:hypothetical protein
MMKRLHEKVEHAVGEVVLGTLGNFLENPNADKKPRPLVVLEPGKCQHLVAGLTTQEFFRTSGERRRPIPNPARCGLRGPGFLWGCRPARISRLDVRRHLGWVDLDLVEVIAETMHVSPDIIERLEEAAHDRHGPGTWQCAV